MTQIRNPQRSLAGRLFGGSFASGVMLRVVWMSGVALVLALTLGPMFAPVYAGAHAGVAGDQRMIEIWREERGPKVTLDHAVSAVRCRSEADGRQEDLLALASAELGGTPVEHVAARFWNEASGTAEVTFEFWHGSGEANRRLYLGRGLVDLDSCAVTLLSLA